MIIKLFDSKQVELYENDIVLFRYPNEKIIYLGLLRWIEAKCEFVLSDGDEDWICFPDACVTSIERISTLENRPDLEKLLGRSVFKTKKEVENFYSKIYSWPI